MVAVLRFRFVREFGKLSTGAGFNNSTRAYRRFDGIRPAVLERRRVNRFVFSRPLVWTLQRTQRRMVGQRAIQVRLVRSLFRFVSLLAPLARPLTCPDRKSQLACNGREAMARLSNRKRYNVCNRDCYAAPITARPPF